MYHDEVTINCQKGRCIDSAHEKRCFGYIAPLVYGMTRKCECECHEGGKRNYHAGEQQALACDPFTKALA